MRVPEDELPCLSAFRSALFKWISEIDENHLIKRRMNWQHSLEIHEAHDRIHRHHHGLSFVPKPRQILVTKNDGLIDIGLVRSLQDITTRPIENLIPMIRLATDSMFAEWNAQNHKTLDKLGTCIRRDRIRNTWVVEYQDRRFLVPSFTHGFFFLRKISEDNTMSMYDSFL
jgi:hypothetical protein